MLMEKMQRLFDEGKYDLAVKEFCEATGTKVIIKFKEKKLNPWNASDCQANWLHNIYKVTIKRNGKQFTFDFTDSKHNTDNGKTPTEYDIMACLTKYDVGTFEDFCNEFGYELYDEEYTGYNKKNYKTYKAVVKEYKNVLKLFYDVMDEFCEIN